MSTECQLPQWMVQIKGEKSVGVRWPLEMEALKVKGLFRQKEPSLGIIQKRKKKQSSKTLFDGHMYCKFCFVWLHLGAVLLLHPEKRKTESRVSPLYSAERTRLVSQDAAALAFAIAMTFCIILISFLHFPHSQQDGKPTQFTKYVIIQGDTFQHSKMQMNLINLEKIKKES